MEKKMRGKKEIISRLEKLARDLKKERKNALAAETMNIIKKIAQEPPPTPMSESPKELREKRKEQRAGARETLLDTARRAPRTVAAPPPEETPVAAAAPTAAAPTAPPAAAEAALAPTPDANQVARTEPTAPTPTAPIVPLRVDSKGDPFLYDFYPDGDATQKIPAGAYKVVALKRGIDQNKTFTEGTNSGRPYSVALNKWINPGTSYYNEFVKTLRINGVDARFLPTNVTASTKPEYIEKIASLREAFSSAIISSERYPFGRIKKG